MIRETMNNALPSKDPGLLRRINLGASFAQAARIGQLCLVEAMVMDGIDVNETDANGRTLLHWAAGNGHAEAVELLLKCGADRTIKDKGGRTAADVAKQCRYQTLSLLLADRGE